MTRFETETRHSLTEADFDGSNAAPLLIVGPEKRPELEARQDQLSLNFSSATEQLLSHLVDQDVVSFVSTSIRNRMHQREGQNGLAYTHRLYDQPHIELIPGVDPDKIFEACEKAKIGQASLAQQAISACAWGMYAWEGKNLTIVDTFRSELEQPMWDEVSEFAGVDAKPKFEAMRGFKVHQFVGGQSLQDPIKAMRIEMKRTIKELDDGTLLKGRTFATINTGRNSGFRQGDIRSIFDAVREEEDLNQHRPLLQIFARLVDDKLPRGVALARNETVYGYNPETEELFNAKRAARSQIIDAPLFSRFK